MLLAPVSSLQVLLCISPQGSFTHSLLYYGYYSNTTLNALSASSPSGSTSPSRATQLPYNMPLAYMFTIGASFFATCILLVYRWAALPALPDCPALLP